MQVNRLTLHLACATALAWSSSFAEVLDGEGTQDLEEFARAAYLGSSEMPNGIAFKIFLHSVESIAQDDETLAIQHLSSKLGWDETDAAELVSRLRVELQDLTEETRLFKREAYCANRSSHSTKDQAYALLDAVDDGAELIAERRYRVFLASLSPRDVALFQQLLNYQKANMSYFKIDNRKLYEAKGVDVLSKLSSTCTTFSK